MCFFNRLVSPLFAHFSWLKVLGSPFQEEEEQRTRSLVSAHFTLQHLCLHRGMQEAMRNKSLLGTMAKKYGQKPRTVNICYSRFLLLLQAQVIMHRLRKCPVPGVLCQPGLRLSKEKDEILRG